jgi:hypothetical protein
VVSCWLVAGYFAGWLLVTLLVTFVSTDHVFSLNIDKIFVFFAGYFAGYFGIAGSMARYTLEATCQARRDTDCTYGNGDYRVCDVY